MELRLVIGQLEEFAKRVSQELQEPDWDTRREVVRALVKKVEIDEQEVRIVYRVSPSPFEGGPQQGSLQHCWGRAGRATGRTSLAGQLDRNPSGWRTEVIEQRGCCRGPRFVVSRQRTMPWINTAVRVLAGTCEESYDLPALNPRRNRCTLQGERLMQPRLLRSRSRRSRRFTLERLEERSLLALTVPVAHPILISLVDAVQGPSSTTLSDSAVLLDGNNETGEITFTLDLTTSQGTSQVDSVIDNVYGDGGYSAIYTSPTLGTGTYTWSAQYSGDNNNASAHDQGGTSEQVLSPIAINWNTPAPIVYGTALSGTQLNATATINGQTPSSQSTFSYATGAGTVLNAGQNTLDVEFTPYSNGNDYAPIFDSVSLDVTPATITIGNDTQTYGSPVNLATDLGTIIAGVNGETLGITYSSTGDTATANVGTYAITGVVSDGTGLASNYDVTLTPGALTVNQAPISYAIGNDSQTYGSPANLANDLGTTIAGVNGETLGITYSSTGDTATANVGTYAITGVVSDGTGLASNYDVTLTPGALTVNQAPISYSIGNDSQVYGSPASFANDLGTTIAGVNGETLGITYSSTGDTATANVGTYAITGAVSDGTGLASNYTVDLTNGKLTVNLAQITIAANNATKVYGAALPALTYTVTGLINGNTLVNLPTITTTATSKSPAGIYTITASGATADSNYTIAYDTGTLVVTTAVLTVTANNATSVYGSTPVLAGVTYSGFVNGDSATSLTKQPTVSTTATKSSPVGTYAITASDAVDPNYIFNYVTGTLNVTPAALKITANHATKSYGAALPPLNVSYSGFVNGDTSGSLTTQPTVTTTATQSSNVGSYRITASGAADPNYTFTYVPSTLTITPVLLVITANPATKVYGSGNPTFTVSYSGFVNGDTASSLTKQPTVTTRATQSSSVGTYSLVPSGAVDSNYTVVYVDGVLTITPKSF